MYPPLQAPSRLLFGPGPSMVHPRVYAAMGQPVVGHLDPFFFQTSEEIRKLLGCVFSTKNEFNMAISGTGSSGMEAAVAASQAQPRPIRRLPSRPHGGAARRRIESKSASLVC